MHIKTLVALFAWVIIYQQTIFGEITLMAPLNTTIVQVHEETLSIEGEDRDLGGKFKIKEKRNIKNNLSVDGISEEDENGLLFDLKIILKNFNENIETSEDDSSDFLAEEVKNLFNIPIEAKFNGQMTINATTSDEYLLFDLGLEFYFRSIFIPIGKELEVGKTFVQEFFLRPDDAATDEDDTLPLEIKDKQSWSNIDDEEYLDDIEPILLIKYTITNITDTAVFADVSGGLLAASPFPSMKPSLEINGKGVWQRSNPMINEISYDFNYSEERTNSWMNVKGFRKTKSHLP